MNIEQIKDKLRKLIHLNPEGEYGYIKDALTEDEVLEFEEKHNIKLPEDYRIFITNMFNGGVGPEQIMPLDFWDSVHNTVYLDSLGNKLNEPFLLISEWKENYDNDDDDDDDENYEYNSIINGTIRVCHIGCGNFIFLVVNGAEYGNLWIDDRASNDEIVPLNGKLNNRINFETWYNEWLDKEIEYYENLSLISKPKNLDTEKIEDIIVQDTYSDVKNDIMLQHTENNSFWTKLKEWLKI
ncbi:MAG: SMI1/KNR4 family protein [Limnohabitans sp.]|nr:SMI1/KNR4 family protein [Limnohabitans sp.]